MGNFVDIIEESCSSVNSLKEEFLGIAEVMFGPGFVWLCKDSDTGRLKILNTYNAGTPYPAAHFRRQGIDVNTERPEDLPTSASLNPLNKVPNGDGNPHIIAPWRANQRYSSTPKQSGFLAPGGADVKPILCVNTWQTVWLPDYGLRNKRLYLEKWWDRIDWATVAKNYGSMNVRKTDTRSFENVGFR